MSLNDYILREREQEWIEFFEKQDRERKEREKKKSSEDSKGKDS